MSIINPREADIIMHTKVDIVDIKDPSRGSLGIPNIDLLIDVATKICNVYECSTALGDLTGINPLISYTAFAISSIGLNYIKAGLEVKDKDIGMEIGRSIIEGVSLSSKKSKIVLVGYADYLRINSIDPISIAEIAYRVGADGIMIDTRIKDGKNTFQFLDDSYLEKFVSLARNYNLFTAIAGSLSIEHICKAIEIGFDVIGFRGAACNGGRMGSVSRDRINRIINEVRACSKRITR